MTRLGRLVFRALTYIPGTTAHKLYIESEGWMRVTDLMLIAAGAPAYGEVASRDPVALREQVQCGIALMNGVESLYRGATVEEGMAVVKEHLPT